MRRGLLAAKGREPGRASGRSGRGRIGPGVGDTALGLTRLGQWEHSASQSCLTCRRWVWASAALPCSQLVGEVSSSLPAQPLPPGPAPLGCRCRIRARDRTPSTALVKNTPDSRFDSPSPSTRPFPPPASPPPGPGTSVGPSSPQGRLAPDQRHLSSPQRPGPGFPKADSPAPGSAVLASQFGAVIPNLLIFRGARGGARSPKRAGLRKGERGGHGTGDVSPPRPSGAPPHPRRAGPEFNPAGSCAAAEARGRRGRAAGPAP